MPKAVAERESDAARKRHRTPEDSSPKRSRKDDVRERDRDRDKVKEGRQDDRKRRDDRAEKTSRRGIDGPINQRPPFTSTARALIENSAKLTQTTGGKSKEALAEELKAKEMVYEAKMKILERIKQQPTTKSGDKFKETVLRPEEASAYTQMHMEKMQRINEIKSRLTRGGTSVLNLKTPSLVLDTINSQSSSALKRELAGKVKQENEAKEKKPPLSTPLQKVEPDSSTEGAPFNEFLDPRLHLKPASRQLRHFEFKQPGEYEKLAKMQRSKAKLERLQAEIEKAAKQTGISSAVKLAIVTPSGLPESGAGEYIPEVEWWDEVVVGNGNGYDDLPSLEQALDDRYSDTITDLVEHPIQLKPPDEPLQPQYLKASLTKKERKKLRRQNRREALKEKAEKIRLGLEKPPDAKLKISNLMRVLGTDAIQDPTKMEAIARKQMAERAQKHVYDNRSRKLTREEKVARAIRRVTEDTSLAVHVVVFKIKSLANPAKKFKMMMNAKQLQMTGAVILLEDINVVVMEGGPKQQKFYRNLMLNRIKWAEEFVGQRHVRKGGNQQSDEGSTPKLQGEHNECTLIWEGIVQKRAFNGEPRFIQAANHKQAREFLDKYGVAHYWDYVVAHYWLLQNSTD